MIKTIEGRRGFIKLGGLFIAAAASGIVFPYSKAMLSGPDNMEEKVSPSEDLMREHGVLKRILLIYEEIIDRIKSNSEFPVKTLSDSAEMIKNFVEDYHEKLEEDHLFPRFRKAGKLVDLVNTLQTQHDRGRILTGKIISLSQKSELNDESKKKELTGYMYSFIRMYSPHEAREDTVLFPAFKTIVSSNEYDSLGEEFEKKEEQLFGEDGFDKMVDKVAGLEKTLGIYDLSKFTPKV